MINRENYLAIQKYLTYRRDVLQKDPLTIRNDNTHLRHFLIWADATSFTEANKIRPVFSRYVATVKTTEYNGRNSLLAPANAAKIVDKARRFLEWATIHLPEYRKLPADWIDTIRPPKMDVPPKERKVVTLEMVRQLIAVPDGGDYRVLRIKAAAAFLFLSGMRATAFVSLPIEAVDLEKLTVRQMTSLGVRTKNRKSAVTVLLNIPELLDVVRQWDAVIRPVLPPASPWFAPMMPNGKFSQAPNTEYSPCRDGSLRGELVDLFRLAKVPYLSPHKFRHGHATHALKQASNISDLKAISQNLMHSNIGITDGIYAILSSEDMQEKISRLGSAPPPAPSVPAQAAGGTVSIAEIVEETLKRLLPQVNVAAPKRPRKK